MPHVRRYRTAERRALRRGRPTSRVQHRLANRMTDTASATVTGAASVVSALERLEVGLAFGLPGVHNLAIWKALSVAALRLVGMRHAQTTVYAADGYARATGPPAVGPAPTGP